MCGIAGIIGQDSDREGTMRQMLACLSHRGPDDEGIWAEETACLGFRRLSIIDTSERGHQPMISSDGRWVIVFNGEIYNFADLREELEKRGIAFKSRTDTEALLEAISAWGVDKAVAEADGMFAFAVWDRRDRSITLGRDRFGEKPLYYACTGGILIFASELKAICRHPRFPRTLDHQALADFFAFSCIPAPRTIYEGCKKLPPAHLLTVSASDSSRAEIRPYWDLERIAERAQAPADQLSDPQACEEEVIRVLGRAVSSRMISDVPLGAFLSGGIDSTTVVAFMQQSSARPVETFTIGSDEKSHDEAAAAAAIAKHLGTNHHELILQPRAALEVIPNLADMYDEPFADSSQIPTHLVARFAKKMVTVALTGDGGDEVFGGYNRYVWGPRLVRAASVLPRAFRHALGASIQTVSPSGWDAAFSAVASGSSTAPRTPGDQMHKLAGVLDFSDPSDLYKKLTTHWESVVLGDVHPQGPGPTQPGNLPVDLWMMLRDQLGYLPSDILTKVDRATMAVSLESRAPFLARDLVELMWRVPPEFKARQGGGRWLQRRILRRFVPDSLLDRPKFGFGIPLHSWLRGPLRDWAEDLLSEDALRGQGLLDAPQIRKRWAEHLSGTRNWQHHLWDVLMFQAWARRNGFAP